MIEDACASSLQEFDLYGVIPATETDHPWHGFSEFKRSFGGYQHDYLGTWEFALKPFQMSIYRFLHKVFG
jgi:lipid II:glycine glycyltransferase (peptidoglycan interpeptide bridge formation enzyme)